jgi:hypothetical protein
MFNWLRSLSNKSRQHSGRLSRRDLFAIAALPLVTPVAKALTVNQRPAWWSRPLSFEFRGRIVSISMDHNMNVSLGIEICPGSRPLPPARPYPPHKPLRRSLEPANARNQHPITLALPETCDVEGPSPKDHLDFPCAPRMLDGNTITFDAAFDPDSSALTLLREKHLKLEEQYFRIESNNGNEED